jgi:hypothetical protein
MPIALDPADRRTLGAAGIVFLALVAATLVIAPGQGVKTEIPSSYSTASGGAKAAYLLLERSGYRVERWERTLGELSDPQGSTLVLADPLEAPGGADLRRLRQFISDGGRVIATGAFAGAFIPDAAIVPRPWMVTWERARALAPDATTRAAPEISLVPQAYWTGAAAVTTLYGDGRHVLVVRYGYGRGEVLWWASATPLTNVGLKEPGNLEFFLSSVGEAGARRVLWDEYFHGYRRSSGRRLARSPLVWFGGQLTLVALVVLATFARRSGPTLAPAGDVRLSPLEFVHTLGGLYQRAGAASVAVDICHQRFRYWLARRLGTAPNAPIPEIEAALRDRWGFEDAGFGPTLRRSEAARQDAGLKARDALRLVRALHRYAAELKLYRVSDRRA